MSGQQAFNQAFPNGVPTQQQQQKAAAKGQQMAGIAQIGGMVGGVVGARYVSRKLDEWWNNGADAAKAPAEVAGAGASSTNNAINQSVAAQGGSSVPTSLRESLTPGSSNGYSLGVDGAAPSGAPGTPQVLSATRVPGPNDALQENGDVLDASSGAKIGQWVQGAGGAYQIYTGAKQWQEGDKLGGGLNVASGVGNLAAASLGQEAVTNAVGTSVMPGLNIATGAYTGYKTADAMGKMPAGGARNKAGGMGGAAAGLSLGLGAAGLGYGSMAVLGPWGLAAGLAAGLIASKTGSGKDKYQFIRDSGRKYLKEQGVLDDNYQGTLADGSKYDFGKDGKKAGKLNTSDPNWGKVAALANVIASGEGTFGRSREAMATMYANAAMSNSGGDYNKALANIQHFANQRGFTPEKLTQQFASMKEQGQLKDNEFATFNADINKVFGGPVAQPKQQQKQQQPVQQQPKQSLAYQKAEAKQNNDFRTQLAKNLYGGK